MNIKDIVPEYLRYLKALGRSYYTLKNTRYDLQRFITFLEAEKILHIEDLTADVLTEYQQSLFFV